MPNSMKFEPLIILFFKLLQFLDIQGLFQTQIFTCRSDF